MFWETTADCLVQIYERSETKNYNVKIGKTHRKRNKELELNLNQLNKKQ